MSAIGQVRRSSRHVVGLAQNLDQRISLDRLLLEQHRRPGGRALSRCSAMRLFCLLHRDIENAAGLALDRVHRRVADAAVGRQRLPEERVLGVVLVIDRAPPASLMP